MAATRDKLSLGHGGERHDRRRRGSSGRARLRLFWPWASASSADGRVTGGTRRATAQAAADAATVVKRLAFGGVGESQKRVALREESVWRRGGWARMPGEPEPGHPVAQARATLLMPTAWFEAARKGR